MVSRDGDDEVRKEIFIASVVCDIWMEAECEKRRDGGIVEAKNQIR